MEPLSNNWPEVMEMLLEVKCNYIELWYKVELKGKSGRGQKSQFGEYTQGVWWVVEKPDGLQRIWNLRGSININR